MIVPALSALIDRYDGFILDLWGVLHDGEKAYPGALECLERLRHAGKRLCLLSNSPRRVTAVEAILAGMGFMPGHYHHLMTSGEATFEALSRRDDPWHARLGWRCLHLGPVYDRQLFEELPGLELVSAPEAADFIVNTGPSTYEETPLDYGPVLERCAGLGLPMICANPDLEVMVGERIVICAGTLAARYRAMGGEVRYHGKPHAAVYQRCFDLLGLADRRRILAVGDTLHTDIAGATAAGLESALISGGILCRELGGVWGEMPDRARLDRLFEGGAPRPTAVLPRLVWA
jgi:HAD superfamily hydrolase (TIGR01459 family)